MTRSLRPSLLVLWLAVGCGATTTNTVARDAATTDATADAGPCGVAPAIECYRGSAGVCGDTFTSPVCRGGAWDCPAGTVRAAMCRCFGSRPGCVCSASGWECPDAGRPFACGDTLRCDLNAEFCRGVSGGVMAGTRYGCEPIPAACAASPTCACVVPEPGASTCRQEADGSIHVSINAP